LVSTYQNSYKELDAAQRAGVISQETYTAQRSTLIRAEREEVTAGYEAEIAALEQAKSRASTSATQRVQLDQKIADARTSMVKAQKDADSQLEVMATAEQGRLAKQTQAVKTYTDALNNQVETLRQQGRQAAATLGMGDRQSSLYQAQNAIDDRVNSQKLDLANQYGDGSRGMSLDEYQQKLAALNKTQQDLHDTVLANYNDMTAAQGDWSAGASAAWQNYLDNGQNVAGQMKTAFTDLYSGLTDATVDWAFGADESFGDVAVSFAKMVANMALQSAASSVFSGGAGVGGLGGIVSSLFGGGAAASAGSTAAGYTGSAFSSWAAAAYSGGGYTGDGGKFEPAGVVHGGEFVLRKEVVSQPGMRNYLEGLNAKGYADGGYVSANASRLSGSSSSGAPQVHISIASDGTSKVSSNTQGLESFGAEIGSFVTQKFKELEAKSLSPQGNIRKAINGRG
jgi:lambda family phage tail tape measure protein